MWRLNKLGNIDKHTRIPLKGVAGIVKCDFFVPLTAKDLTLTEFDNNHVMKIFLSLKGQMALNRRVPEFKVLFGDLYWKIECDFDGIEAIYEFVTIAYSQDLRASSKAKDLR